MMLASSEGTQRAEPGFKGRNRAVFVDRDGVLNEATIHAHEPRLLRMIPGGREAMQGFKDLGFLRIIVTNQAGIAKGLFTVDDLVSFTEELWKGLGPDPWDAYYYCPYHSTGTVEGFNMDSFDRKPQPGMILRGALDMDVDLTRSYMIGDHLKDVVAAHRAGCKGILVMTGRGKAELTKLIHGETRYGPEALPDATVQDLGYAFGLIKEWER